MLEQAEWGEYKIGDLFGIASTKSFDSDALVEGDEYDYVSRTSQNQGILCQTGFVNIENINPAGTWSLGLLQMDFFYRRKPWYAGQFVRMVFPKIELNNSSILFFSVVLNRLKPLLLNVLVRNVDETFLNEKILLPTRDGEIDYDFIDGFIAALESQRIAELEAYLTATGIKDYRLTEEEEKALDICGNWDMGSYTFSKIFNNIKQGRRLKKDDQREGDIPFVMSGVSNTGVVNFISNPVAVFPKNSITVDIFGNVFYRNYEYGAGDDTGVYWSTQKEYTKEQMLFFAASMSKALFKQHDFDTKLRSSQSLKLEMLLPTKDGEIDYSLMDNFIRAIEKLVIRDVVEYADSKIAATKQVVDKDTN